MLVGGVLRVLRARGTSTLRALPRPTWTCTRRKRRPMMYARRKSGFTCSGVASVAMSKSFGVRPSRRSRTAPPTTKRLEARLVQLLDHLPRAARNLLAADRMLAGAVDARFACRPAGDQAGEQAADHCDVRWRVRGVLKTARDHSTRATSAPRPGARPSSVQAPTDQRTSRSVGSPTAAVMRRTWRLRPSSSVTFDPGGREWPGAFGSADRAATGPAGSGDGPRCDRPGRAVAQDHAARPAVRAAPRSGVPSTCTQ